MIPTIGRTVIVVGLRSNGSTLAPGIITKVHSKKRTEDGPVAVNVTAFPDNDVPKRLSSVMLYHTPKKAHDAQDEVAGFTAHFPVIRRTQD